MSRNSRKKKSNPPSHDPTVPEEGGMVVNSTDPPLKVAKGTKPNRKVRLRVMAEEIYEHRILYDFEKLRYEVDDLVSHPFTRNRFDAKGRKYPDKDDGDKKAGDKNEEEISAPWREIFALQLKIDETRRKVFGTTFSDQQRIFRSQSELRTLAAQCHAFRESYSEAVRELRQARSGLDPANPTDKFLCGVIHGRTAEVYLLRADAAVRRRLRGALEEPEGATHYARQAPSRWRRAKTFLGLAANSLENAETLIRSVRANVSRWEWLHEIRAQLAIERVLLRAVELNFDIEAVKDDWRFVGELQRDVSIGLEAIRAGLDCTIYPHHLTDLQTGGDKDPDYERIRVVHGRLIALWLNLMVVHLWILRLFAVRPHSAYSPRHASRLLAVQTIDAHASIASFFKRWRALNYAVGLEKLVGDDDDQIHQRGASDTKKSPGACLREILNVIGTVSQRPLVQRSSSDLDDPRESLLREVILEQMSSLNSPKDYVKEFQKTLV